MQNAKTISWILLATALASQAGPAKFDAISMIADGINRAVPTDKELRSCISWLLDKGFVKGDQNKYSLTESGRKLIGNAETKHDAVFKIWKYLEKDISKLV